MNATGRPVDNRHLRTSLSNSATEGVSDPAITPSNDNALVYTRKESQVESDASARIADRDSPEKSMVNPGDLVCCEHR